MSRPVCVQCQVEFRPVKCGIAAEAMATFGSYQLFMADLYQCPGCGISIVHEFSTEPIAEHFQENYTRNVEARSAGRPHVQYWRNLEEKRRYEREREAERDSRLTA